jgi:uncharacterized protein YycO
MSSSILNTLWEKGVSAFGDVMLRTSQPHVKACHIRSALRLVRPGAVVCRKFNCYLDQYVIPGKPYTHSGICESDDYVIHSIAEGVERIDLIDFIKDSDGFAILYPVKPDGYSHAKAIDYARKQIGKPYDFYFHAESGDRVAAFFCHELTARSLEAGGVKIVPELRSLGPVVKEVWTADLFTDDPKMSCVYEANV